MDIENKVISILHSMENFNLYSEEELLKMDYESLFDSISFVFFIVWIEEGFNIELGEELLYLENFLNLERIVGVIRKELLWKR